METLLKKFANEFKIGDEFLIDRVIYLAFFHHKHGAMDSFSYEDIREWFDAMGWAEPNKTRLLKKIKSDKRIIRGKKADVFKLQHKQLFKLEEDCAAFDFKELFSKANGATGVYISQSRIDELETIQSEKFDLNKLLQICKELNSNFREENIFSIGALVRILIDHVPPIFDFSNFNEVCSNYSGPKSFKKAMTRLNTSSRDNADLTMHTQARKTESLPTGNQVDFTTEIELLLGEIVRILK